jgi:transposase
MVTNASPGEFQPLPSTREERGRQIARLGGIRSLGGRYVVPSQSESPSVPTYLVDVIDETCTCPDYETRRQRCKHQEAVLFWLAWEGTVNAETGEVTQTSLPALSTKPRRKTYRQDWRSYEAAQTTERERVPQLLHSLCETVEEPAREPGRPGRKPIPRREAIYSIATKVYSLCSGRRAEPDIKAAVDRGHLSRVWDPNTLFRVMEDPALTPVLVRLIMESSAPLAGVERLAGAQDSTGFPTVSYERWFDEKHGKLRSQHAWVKLHLMVGTVTHVVTAAKVSGDADCPVLPETLQQTRVYHRVQEVSADKAYLAKYNLAAIADGGAEPFIPFKTNSVGMESTSPHWRKMWCLFQLKAEEFQRSYHRRSNVESAIGSIKARCGGLVRSRTAAAQCNEVLAKVLLHNLACVVHAIEKYGIGVSFPLGAVRS